MLEKEKTFGFTIKAFSNQMKRMFDKRAIRDNEAGLTGMQLAVLGFIADTPARGDRDVFQRDIEEEFDIRRSTATSILQLMEKNGVLRRESVSGDLRLKRIVLTEKGLALQEKQGKRMKQIDAILVQGIPAEDLTAFYRVMETATENIRRHLAKQ